MREPIVVTGMGVVSPLGRSLQGMWRRLIASESGLRRLPDEIVPAKDRRKMDRFGGVNASIVIQRMPQGESGGSVSGG